MISGIEKNVSTGFTKDVMIPRIAATISRGTRLCWISSMPCLGPPVKRMPSNSQAAAATPSAVVRSRRMMRMGASVSGVGGSAIS